MGVWSIILYYEQNLWVVGIRVFSEMKMKHLRQDPDPGCASLQIQLVSDIASSCPQPTVTSQAGANYQLHVKICCPASSPPHQLLVGTNTLMRNNEAITCSEIWKMEEKPILPDL